MKRRLILYYNLTKPGIIRGNLITATAGFLLASGSNISAWLLFAVWVGTALVIASGCVFNNYIDQPLDKKMERTKKRALVSGEISGRSALTYGAALGIIGLGVLALWTNWLTFALGLAGLFFYLVVYGIAKRRSVLGTIIGSIAGALPPVAGYTAVSGTIDGAAVLLFLTLTCWQMPHFYAIAMFRRDEYAAASLPVLPVVHGMRTAKVHILAYTAAFVIVSLLLPVFGYVSPLYAFFVGSVGVAWLIKGITGFKTHDDVAWGRGMFFFSLAVLMVFSVSIAVDVLLFT